MVYPIPVERVKLTTGEVVDLATPRMRNQVDGLSLSGVQRTPQGDVTRVIHFSYIESRVALAYDEYGQVVEDPDLPLPSLA